MNLEKFMALPLGRKIKWIVDYYGIPIIVGIVAIAVLTVMVKSVFFPEPESDICVLISSDEVPRDDMAKIEKAISDYTGHTATVEIYTASDDYGRQAFAIKLTSNQVDIVVAPKEQTMEMSDSGYLSEYEEISGSGMYIGTPQRARSGDEINAAGDYLRQFFKGDI